MSEYIRLLIGRCEACGRTEGLQHAHIITRGALYMRYERSNALCLCAYHHRQFHDSPAMFRMFLSINYPQRLEYLRNLPMQKVDIATVIQDLDNKLNRLKSQ